MGWNLDIMGMMGMLRGNFCREGGVRLWVRVWSGECILVDFIKTVSKSSRKSMCPEIRIDRLWCMYRTVMRKYKA